MDGLKLAKIIFICLILQACKVSITAEVDGNVYLGSETGSLCNPCDIDTKDASGESYIAVAKPGFKFDYWDGATGYCTEEEGPACTIEKFGPIGIPLLDEFDGLELTAVFIESEEQSFSDTGDFTINVEPTSIEEHEPYVDIFKDAEPLVKLMNDAIGLSEDIHIVFGDCYEINAFYLQSSNEVIMCYELLYQVMFNSLDTVDYLYGDQYAEYFDDTAYVWNHSVAFILLHEVAHALIDIYDMPVFGGHEDSADGIASALYLMGEGQSAEDAVGLITAATNFLYTGSYAYTDNHSVGAQRAATLMCYAIGAYPEVLENQYVLDVIYASNFQDLLTRSCEGEYMDLKNSIEQILGDQLKQPLH